MTNWEKGLLKGTVKALKNKVKGTVNILEFIDLETPIISGVTVGTVILIVVVSVVAIILERLITRYVRRLAKRAHLAPNVANSLVLTFRLLILLAAVASLVRVGGLPTEWFVALSALGGAAIGFASTKTIGNFVAGLFLFAARPFKVGDYVRVGAVEGIVQEVTINYTKILTMGNNVVSIINIQLLDRDITNFTYRSEENEDLYCYTFEVGFDHSISAAKCGEIFSEVFEVFAPSLPKRPSYVLLRSAAFERVFMVYVYVKNPEDIFVLRPRIAEEVFKHWDEERAKGKL